MLVGFDADGGGAALGLAGRLARAPRMTALSVAGR